MTKQEQQDVLFSLHVVHGYLKHYGTEDYDQDHVLNHLKPIIERVESDKRKKLIVEIMHADEKDGLYDIEDKLEDKLSSTDKTFKKRSSWTKVKSK